MEAYTLEGNMWMEWSFAVSETNEVGFILPDRIPDKFYLSGSEIITFKRNSKFALQAVLTSAVSFNDELLILENEKDSLPISALCEKHRLSYSCIKHERGNAGYNQLRFELAKNSHISHVLKVLDSSSDSFSDLCEMAHLCEQSDVDLILYCKEDMSYKITEFLNLGASFIVFSSSYTSKKSSVIAQRRSLVKTEGKSPSFCFDLYAYWQKSLHTRDAFIEPMMG